MKLLINNEECVFEVVEHPSLMDALQHLEVSNHNKVLVVAGRCFSMTDIEADKVYRSDLQKTVLMIRGSLLRVETTPDDNGQETTADNALPVINGDRHQGE